MQKTIINHKQSSRREQTIPATSQYHVFLVRMWSNADQDPESVRITAENTRTGERTGFSEWDDLSHYLKKNIETLPA